MIEAKSLRSLAVLALVSISCADQAADLRNEVDAKLQEKLQVRNEREGLLNQLHIFSDNREVKKTNLDTKEKYLLFAYRDQFTKKGECDSLDYERQLLDGIHNVEEFGECLPVPLADSAKGINKAKFQNDFLEPINDAIQSFYGEQARFLSQWGREANHYDVMSSLYYPSGPYQQLAQCLQANPGHEQVCDDLQVYAETVESIYGNFRSKAISIGFSSKGPSINLSWVRDKLLNLQAKVQANTETLQNQEATVKQNQEYCRENEASKLNLLNSRITERNSVKDNLESQRDMVTEYLGYINDKVNTLETKTDESGVIVDHLSDVELN